MKDVLSYEKEILSDVDIMEQLNEGKNKCTKVRDFEELAKELWI